MSGHQQQQHTISRDDEKTFYLHWDVPLSQFEVDRRLYRPKPALLSPLMTIHTDRLSLQWQLSLEQGRSDARVFLHHKTPHVPNQGVQYTVYAMKTDGTTARLTAAVRRNLGTLRKTDSDSTDGGFMKGLGRRFLYHPTMDRRFAWNRDMIKLRVIITLNNNVWNPRRILDQKIRGYKARHKDDHRPGLIGERLWSNVRILQKDDPIPPDTDLLLICPNADERIAAHKAVVACFSEPFFDAAVNQSPRGGGIFRINSIGIGSTALWEILHFIYLRTVSSRFYRAPLNEILEAVRVFRLSMVLNWEVEKVFTQILDDQNRAKMLTLAEVYGLGIVSNMIKKSMGDTVASGFKLEMVAEDEEPPAEIATNAESSS